MQVSSSVNSKSDSLVNRFCSNETGALSNNLLKSAQIFTSDKTIVGESIDGSAGVHRGEKGDSNQGDVEHKVTALADVRVVVKVSDVSVLYKNGHRPQVEIM